MKIAFIKKIGQNSMWIVHGDQFVVPALWFSSWWNWTIHIGDVLQGKNEDHPIKFSNLILGWKSADPQQRALQFYLGQMQNPRSKTQNPKPKIQNPNSKNQNPQIQKPKSHAPKSKRSKIANPKLKIQNPRSQNRSKIPNSKFQHPKVQDPKSNIQIEHFRTKKPTQKAEEDLVLEGHVGHPKPSRKTCGFRKAFVLHKVFCSCQWRTVHGAKFCAKCLQVTCLQKPLLRCCAREHRRLCEAQLFILL